MDPEKVEIVEVFENDIELYLHIWADTYGFKDIAKVTPRQWNWALEFVYEHVFKPKEKNKLLRVKAGDVDFNTKIKNSNCNAYDKEIILYIYNIYKTLCNRYDKSISKYGFKELTNIDYNTMDNMYNKNIVSNMSINLNKKIDEDRKNSLIAKLEEKGSNTLGYITILNNEYNWSTQNVKTEHINPSLTAEELPQLGGNSVKALSDTQKSDGKSV